MVTLPPNPDLQVESVTPAASQFQAGGTLGLQFVVINQGTVATTTPHWTDSVYLSLDDTLSGDDILLASVRQPVGAAARRRPTHQPLRHPRSPRTRAAAIT